MNYLSIDTEYTSSYSIDESKSGELLQVSIVPIIDGVPNREDAFNEYCAPQTRLWNKKAEEVHGISQARARSFQHPSELAKKLQAWLERHDDMFTVVGYNCRGDKCFIERLIMKYKLSKFWFFKVRPEWIDVYTMVRNRKHLIPKKSLKLTSMCEYFGIQFDGAHDAINDAVACFMVWERVKAIRDPKEMRQEYLEAQVSVFDKRRTYLDMKYVMMNGDGSVFITEHATKSKEALRIILEEIWNVHQEHKE